MELILSAETQQAPPAEVVEETSAHNPVALALPVFIGLLLSRQELLLDREEEVVAGWTTR